MMRIKHLPGWNLEDSNSFFRRIIQVGVFGLLLFFTQGLNAQCDGSNGVPVVGGVTSMTQSLCDVSNNGTATVYPFGGTGSYSLLWSNGQTTETATGLGVGTYSVTITDGNGCTAVASQNVELHPEGLWVDVNTSGAGCANGTGGGSATAVATYGTDPLTYQWSDGQTTQTATGLAAGTYGVTVTDANGCSRAVETTISQGAGIGTYITASYETCAGSADAQATVVAWDGVAPYTYQWSDGQTTDIATGLSAGNYSVTVTDANGCSAVAEVTVELSPEGLWIMLSSTPASCGGSDGTAYVGVMTGVAPFTYQWSDGQTTETATGLAPGTYTVTVTDANSCTNEGSVVVGSDNVLNVGVSSTSASCAGNDGTATADVANGTGTLTYQWSDGQTTQTATGLAAGTYGVTVTDDAGCLGVGEVNVGSDGSSTIVPNASLTNNATCDTDGTASASASGGTAPYTYTWSNGATGETISAPAGDYTVVVTDATGCTAEQTVTIGSDGGTTPATISTNDPTSICTDGNPDPINVDVDGGTGANAAWVITDADGNILGLPAGPPFDLDGAGEGTCLIWYLTFDDGLTGAEVGMNANDLDGCFSLSNPITVERNNITIGNYVWNDLNQDGIQGQDEPGVSDIMVKLVTAGADGEYCTADDVIVMQTVTDDTGNYQFQCVEPGEYIVIFMDSSLPDGYVFTGQNAGDDDAADSDANGEGKTDPFVITAGQDDDLTIDGGIYESCGTEPSDLSTTDPTTICVDGTPDPINVDVTGGAGTNTAWVITDADGNILALPAGPPFDLDGAGTGVCLIWYLNFEDGLTGAEVGMNANNLEGCFSLSNPITVTRNEFSGNLDVSSTPTACGEANGSASVVDEGLTYTWSNGETGASISGLTAGSYTVMATDAAGCTGEATVTVDGSDAPDAATISTNDPTTICIDGTPDPINVDVAGGTGANAAWVITDADGNILALPAGSPFDLDGAGAGTCLIWYLTFEDGLTGAEVGNNATTDLAGCFALSNPITVERNEGPEAVINPSDPTICSGQSVQFSTSASGSGLTYEWSANGGSFNDENSSNPIYTMMMPGIYDISVVVTDAAGCSSTDNTSVTVTQLECSAQVTSEVSTQGGNDGAALATATGGTAPYSYLWSTGDDSSGVTGLSAGTYQVTITDANGCSCVATVTLGDGAPECTNIGNYVWVDTNQDGIQDADEEGLAGVMVKLLDTDDNIIQQTTTDADGFYLFTDVCPGDYYIQFMNLPDIYVFTDQDAGDDDELDSDADSNGNTDVFTVTSGQDDDLSFDAGVHLVCDDCLNGGEIGYDQDICPGEVPFPIISVNSPSCNLDDLEYLWMCNTNFGPNSSDTWMPIPNTNSETYQPGALFEDKAFIRCVRAVGCDTFIVESNTIIINVLDADDPECTGDQFPVFGTALKKSIKVEWTMGPETEEYTYVVERSDDGVEFYQIGTVEGKGNALFNNEYLFIDTEPRLGHNYYQVRQINVATQVSRSSVADVVFTIESMEEIFVYPNPATNKLNVEAIEALDSDATLELVNTTGQVIHVYNLEKNAMLKEIDLTGIAAGAYYLRVKYDNAEKDTTVIKVFKN